jgi:hypothetical protein
MNYSAAVNAGTAERQYIGQTGVGRMGIAAGTPKLDPISVRE